MASQLSQTLNKPIKTYYNALLVLSYNAVLTIIRTTRNTGKTWAFEIRAWRRAIKHGKRTLWLRTFKKEVRQAIKKLYHSKDLQKKCGIIPYNAKNNAKNNTGNFKREGNAFYYRKNNKSLWRVFMEVFAVSDANALRSADDVDTDTIVYDEADSTIDKQHRYHGNIVTDFIDAFISTKREHKVRCILLCNKESIRNPFIVYFNLPPLPMSFEGIRQYKGGSIVIEQRNTKPKDDTEYDNKVNKMLEGTAYGNYLKGAYKNSVAIRKRKAPLQAYLYVQLDISGYKINISVLDGNYYVSNHIDSMRRVCVLKPLNKYKNELLLIKRFKNNFINLMNALADNRVYYDNEVTYEAIQPFYEWLGI